MCVNLLEEWQPTFGLEDCVQGILFLLYEPNLEDTLSDWFFPNDDITFLKAVKRSLKGERVYCQDFPFNLNHNLECSSNGIYEGCCHACFRSLEECGEERGHMDIHDSITENRIGEHNGNKFDISEKESWNNMIKKQNVESETLMVQTENNTENKGDQGNKMKHMTLECKENKNLLKPTLSCAERFNFLEDNHGSEQAVYMQEVNDYMQEVNDSHPICSYSASQPKHRAILKSLWNAVKYVFSLCCGKSQS